MTDQAEVAARTGRYAAYAGLAVAVAGLPLLGASDAGCRFVGSATQDYRGYVGEPGNTGAILAFTLAPVLAGAALFLLARAVRAGRPRPLPARAACFAVFPLAVVNFVIWAARGTFACGTPFL